MCFFSAIFLSCFYKLLVFLLRFVLVCGLQLKQSMQEGCQVFEKFEARLELAYARISKNRPA